MKDVWILNTGMITAVGLNSAQTVTSVRAGINRYRESSLRNKRFSPITLALIPDDHLTAPNVYAQNLEVDPWRHRLLQIAAIALQEVSKDLSIHEALPLFLGVARPLNEDSMPLNRDFLSQLQMLSDVDFDIPSSKIFPNGRAAGLLALHDAYHYLQSDSVKSVLVGAVDSYFDVPLLNSLDAIDRVLAEGAMDAFCPGEGACFLLLSNTPSANSVPLAKLVTTATGLEPGHFYSDQPYRGEGLAHTLKTALSATSVKSIQSVYASFNGENFWAKEWGVAYLRNREKFSDQFTIEHPADCFGDTGAALGPLLVGIAAHTLHRGLVTPECLVWCSSDHAERAAVVLTC